jgi:GNAT superfamily N-acetyltransferase
LIRRQDRFELAKMGVAETARGKGVGRALLEHVIGEARRLGIRKIYLESNKVLENAIHLYESVGFRHVTPEEPSPFARSDVYMEWSG